MVSSLNATPHFGKIIYQVEDAKRQDEYKALPFQQFDQLIRHSGLANELQGSMDNAQRAQRVYQPQSYIVVAKDDTKPEGDDFKTVGVGVFTHNGEYVNNPILAIDPDYQRQGIGKGIIREGILHGRDLVKTHEDQLGEVSLATLTASDHFDQDIAPNRFAKAVGYQPLGNAAVITRRQQRTLDYLS